jgi:hypothetical protein
MMLVDKLPDVTWKQLAHMITFDKNFDISLDGIILSIEDILIQI